jgi:hypothetical protein
MAWLQTDPSGNQPIDFRFGGKKCKRSLRLKDLKNAPRKLIRLDETIDLIEAGRIEIPGAVDVPRFWNTPAKSPEVILAKHES